MDLRRIIYNFKVIFNTKFLTMASLRRLKKDIDMLMSMVLNDCFYTMEYNPKIDHEAVMKLAGDVILQHREFRIRANHPDNKNEAKQIKQYYNKLVTDLLDTTNRDLETLSEEVKKTT